MREEDYGYAQCIDDRFGNFTYGRVYKGLRRSDRGLLVSDNDGDSYPVASGSVKFKHIDGEDKAMTVARIWTDGAASNNGKADAIGGWGYVTMLRHPNGEEEKFEGYGREDGATNNQMEIQAVIEALKALPDDCKNCMVHADSAYVVNAFKQGWLENWKRRGWKTADGNPVKNQSHWAELDRLVELRGASIKKTKGHADDEYNNRADELAVYARTHSNKKESKEKKGKIEAKVGDILKGQQQELAKKCLAEMKEYIDVYKDKALVSFMKYNEYHIQMEAMGHIDTVDTWFRISKAEQSDRNFLVHILNHTAKAYVKEAPTKNGSVSFIILT